MEVEQSLDEIIKQRGTAKKLARGGAQREKGANFARRQARVGRRAALNQARGIQNAQPVRAARTKRRFGSAGILQMPMATPMMSPIMTTPAPVRAPAQPKVVVLPVMTTQSNSRTRGGAPVLTKASRRQLSQAISQITQQATPVKFNQTFTPAPARRTQRSTPRAQQPQRRKIIRQPQMQMMTTSGMPMMMMPGAGRMMYMPAPPMMMAAPGQGILRQPFRRQPRSATRRKTRQ